MNSPMADDDGPVFEWYPIRLFLLYPGYKFALVVLNQPFSDEALFRDLWATAFMRVAADGGANHIYKLNTESASGQDYPLSELDVIIGDLDSLSDEARAFFTTTRGRGHRSCRIIQDADQYATDFTKAVRLVRKELSGRHTHLVCLGGLGGRADQGLSQLHHLYMFQTSPTYADGRMFLLSPESLSFVLKPGRHRIHVRERGALCSGFARVSGDPFAKYVGIVPVGRPSVITTRGLEWDVQDWPTEFGVQMSTSNHVLPETDVVVVETTEDVLFTIAWKEVQVVQLAEPLVGNKL
ncbi:Uu.00g055880.m01.CDS01 [Anthostomella pinea]|uniref:Thiamine pyrophosphokinase n=1 Tax=Anthostomella pinea TaxID=933095 RepID=A0AAI8YPQ7_9PEZI|nr:Uu.00g055880.m01.CDS01 [Anthostomella pinea]